MTPRYNKNYLYLIKNVNESISHLAFTININAIIPFVFVYFLKKVFFQGCHCCYSKTYENQDDTWFHLLFLLVVAT